MSMKIAVNRELHTDIDEGMGRAMNVKLVFSPDDDFSIDISLDCVNRMYT